MSSELSHKPLPKKGVAQALWDALGIPARLVLFDQKWLPRFGWTTLEEERISWVLPFVTGRLLDIGAGPNTLVKRYLQEGGDPQSLGVDVVDWGGGVKVVQNTSKLPEPDASFDTVTMVACLNHIPYRQEVIHEAARVLKPDGRMIFTMIGPVLGEIGHKIWWYSEDKHRDTHEDETGGMNTSEIISLCQNAGFHLRVHKRFVYGMNNLTVFTR